MYYNKNNVRLIKLYFCSYQFKTIVLICLKLIKKLISWIIFFWWRLIKKEEEIWIKWIIQFENKYPCLHFEFWSGGKSSSPSFELSFGGDELWVISDARSPSMLG